MNKTDLIELIRGIANTVGVPCNLALAIAFVETGLVSEKTRYESGWDYLLYPSEYAQKLGITTATETVLQKFSWGCMQVMGSVSRELGFSDHLPLLVKPELGALFGCRKLHALIKNYPSLPDVISSYNAGSPLKYINGEYHNQSYVDQVTQVLIRLNKGGTL